METPVSQLVRQLEDEEASARRWVFLLQHSPQPFPCEQRQAEADLRNARAALAAIHNALKHSNP
jgi:hypothetical protein